MGEGSEDFSTLKMFFIIVLIFFLRNVYKSAGCCSTQMAPCRYQLMLIQLCFRWLLTMRIFIANEKKLTAHSQHSAPFADCLTDFSPTHASSFILTSSPSLTSCLREIRQWMKLLKVFLLNHGLQTFHLTIISLNVDRRHALTRSFIDRVLLLSSHQLWDFMEVWLLVFVF